MTQFKTFLILIVGTSLLLLSGCKDDGAGDPSASLTQPSQPDTSAEGKVMDLSIDQTNEVIPQATVVFGPEKFKSVDFQLTRTVKTFDLVDLSPGRYRMKTQNGNYGPFLYKQCELISVIEQKRQCQYDNIVEQIDRQFARVDKANAYVNSQRVFYGKTVTKAQANFEEPVNLLSTDQPGVSIPLSVLTNLLQVA